MKGTFAVPETNCAMIIGSDASSSQLFNRRRERERERGKVSPS
jgi:hypothetical protein